MITVIKSLLIIFSLNVLLLLKTCNIIPFDFIDNFDSNSLNSTILSCDLSSEISIEKNLIYSPLLNFNDKDVNFLSLQKNNLFSFLLLVNKINSLIALKYDNITFFNYYCNFLKFDIHPYIKYFPNRHLNDWIRFRMPSIHSKDLYSYYSMNVPYYFPPLSSSGYIDQNFSPFLNIYPNGAIVQIKFPTDEIELIYSTVKPKNNIIETLNDINNLISKNYSKYSNNNSIKNLAINPDLNWEYFLPLLKFEFFKIKKQSNINSIHYFNVDFNIKEIEDYELFQKSISCSNKPLEIKPPFIMYLKTINEPLPFYFAYCSNDDLIEKYNIFNVYYLSFAPKNLRKQVLSHQI